MLRPRPSVPLEAIAGLLAWGAAALPAATDLLADPASIGVARAIVAGIVWIVFGVGFAAVASWRLADRSYRFHRALLALLTVLAATFVASLPSYGSNAILFILTAVIAAHVLPAAWALSWIAVQGAWVWAMTGSAGADASTALLQAAAYLSFMLFAYLTTRAGLREAEARSQLARRNAELRATRSLLAEHERVTERLRIARNLHDLLGHRLTALILNLDVAGRTEGTDARAALGRADRLARSLLDAVREAVRSVRAEDAVDVSSALRSLVADLPEPEVTLRLPERILVADPRAAHALLSCTQEVVTNTVRHADARHLWIEVRQDDDGLLLDARDDGRGAPSGVGGGAGLRGMRERFEALGGRVEVVATARPGFAVRAYLPAAASAAGDAA